VIQADLWIPNIRGDLTLHEAVHSGRKDLVRWLLSQKSQNMVNVANNDGKCPLHIAAINNNVEMCKVIFCPLFKYRLLFCSPNPITNSKVTNRNIGFWIRWIRQRREMSSAHTRLPSTTMLKCAKYFFCPLFSESEFRKCFDPFKASFTILFCSYFFFVVVFRQKQSD
jgi:ankyrin repeat protein